MPSINGVDFVHSVSYFTKGIDSQGPYFDVEYHIEDWADSDATCNALLGLASYGGANTINTGPHRHPLSPNLICISAVCTGRGRPDINENGYPGYLDGAIIRAQYRSPAYVGGAIDARCDPGWVNQLDPTNPQPWATQTLSSGSEIFTLTDHEYKIAYGGGVFKPSGSPVQVEIQNIQMHLTYHRLPYLPLRKLRTFRGMVNSTPFLGVEFAGHVRFMDWSTTKTIMTDGTVGNSLNLTFVEREKPWNEVLLPNKLPTDTDAWGLIVSPTGGVRYPEAELNELLIL